MPNTSASGGYLLPTGGPLEDQALDVFFQNLVVGVTGMNGAVVFPRWQAVPPNLPNVDWASAGVIDTVKDTFAAIVHDPAGLGADGLQRHEVVEVLVSFYGPNAGANASTFADGLQVSQNREPLRTAGMGLVETRGPVNAPALLKGIWTRKKDVRMFVRRIVERTYAVESLVEGDAGLYTDEGLPPRPIVVTNP